MKRFLTRWSFLLLLLLLTRPAAFAQLEYYPHLIADDIITFTGGTVDPGNPDIYVINMGDPTLLNNKISLTLTRPKGADANYSVTVNAYLYYTYTSMDYGFQYPYWENKEIRFDPGQSEATLEFKGWNDIPAGLVDAVFIGFKDCNRTKTEQSIVQLNFTLPASSPVERTSAEVTPYAVVPQTIGQYILFDNFFSGHVNIAADQTLRLIEQRGTGADDLTASETISLTPRNVGSTSKRSVYLHKLTEEATIPGYLSENGRPVPAYLFKLLGIDNLKDAVGEDTYAGEFTDFTEETTVLLSDTSRTYFDITPRIENIRLSADSYKGYDVGKITATIPNMDLYMKGNSLTNTQDALGNISVVLFGINHFFSEEGWDPVTREATLLFDVPVNTSGADSTVYAEFKVWMLKGTIKSDYHYPYGAYTTFIHGEGTVALEHRVETIEIKGLPDGNVIFRPNEGSPYPSYQLRADVSPKEAMRAGKWTSSNTEVAVIDENTGLLQALADGVTTIRFTSSEVARRAELGIDPNDEVLIQECRIVVGGLLPKFSIQPKLHPYEEASTVINFSHNFKVAGWTPTAATITIYEGDSEKDIRTVTIKMNDSGFLDRTFQYTMPYGEDGITKEASRKDENDNYLPTYWIKFEVTLKSENPDLQDRTEIVDVSYPLYVLFPANPKIRIVEENLKEFYSNGVQNDVTYEVGWLNLGKDFQFIYKVTGFKAEEVDELGVVTRWSEAKLIGEEVINGDKADTELEAEGLSRTGKFTVTYTPDEPTSEYDYTEIRITVINTSRGATQYLHTTQIKSTKAGQMIESFKSFASPKFVENWEDVAKLGIKTSELEKYQEDKYNSDNLYSYLQANWPSKMFYVSYPQSWGTATLTLDHGGESPSIYGVNHVSTFRVDYPLKGGTQKLTMSWEGRESKEYEYTFEGFENKLYAYRVTGYDLGKPLYVSYTDGKGTMRNREVTCSGTLCIYEPNGIQGSIFVQGKYGDFCFTTIKDVKPIGSGSVFKSTNSFDNFITQSHRLVRGSRHHIRMSDASGNPISSGTLNYVTLDPSNAVINRATHQMTNGYFLIPLTETKLLDNAGYTLYMEISAEGYQPYLLAIDHQNAYNNENVHAVLKGTAREDKHAAVVLTENNKKISLQNNSLNDVVGFTDEAKNTLLSLWLPVEKGSTAYSVSDYELQGGATGAKKAVGKIIKGADFKYDYVELTYNIDDYIGKQATASLSVVAKGKTQTRLPALKNITIDPDALAEQLGLPLNEGGDLDNMKHVDVGGNFDKAFDNFDMTLPSMLPVTLQIVKEGDEYIVRGIYSYNVVPGGDVMDKIALLADFETLFNEISSQLSQGQSYGGTNTYFSAGAFVGFKGFVAGKATYNPNKTGVPLELDFVDIGIKAEMSANFHSQFTFIVVFGFGIDAELSAELKLSKPSAAELAMATNFLKANLVLTNKLALDLYVRLGFGINLLFYEYSAGIEGGGGGSHVQQIIFKPYNASKSQAGFRTDVRAYINVWAYERFLWMSERKTKTIVAWDRPFYYPDNASNPLKTTTKSVVSRVGDVYTRADIQGLTSLIPLVDNVESNALPQYIDGGKIVYTDIKDPTNYNDDRVMVYNSSPDPEQLDEEEEVSGPAYNLSAASQGANSLVAYEELIDGIDPNDLVDMEDEDLLRIYSAKMDIIASLNGVRTSLSDNDYMANMKPKAALNGDYAGVVWTSGSLEVGKDKDGEMEIAMNGHLVMSRYDGTDWKKYELLPVNATNTYGAYSIAMDADGTALIAIEKIEGEEATIQLISVAPDKDGKKGEITLVDTGKKGHAPVIKSFGENFILSYLTGKNEKTVEEGMPEEDIYFALIGKDGKPNGISGFGNLSKKIPQNYQLIVADGATALSDISVLWNEPRIDEETGKFNSAILAAKLGMRDNQFYTSQPTEALAIPEDVRLFSYDGYLDGDELKVVACLGNSDLGASIVEGEVEYANGITLLAERVPYTEILPGATVKIGFSLGNDGYLPVKSVKVKFDDDAEIEVDATLMPRYSGEFQVDYTIPEALGTVDYTITAVFEDNSTAEHKGSIDLSTIDLGVRLLSRNTVEDQSTLLVEVFNETPFALAGSETITVGLYKDIRGEEPYPGTSEQTVRADELYNAADGNLSTLVSFEIDQPKESVALYALVKTAGVKEMNQMNNSAVVSFIVDTKTSPDAVYYTVSIPQIEGLAISPSKDAVVEENGSLTITVSALEGYSMHNMVFYVNGIETEPDKVLANGSRVFTISPITGDVRITITGVTKGSEVANVELPDGLRMYHEEGYLVIENNTASDKTDTVVLYTIQGQILINQDLPVGITRIPVDTGAYVIVIKGIAYKVII